jgi:2-polyprenyl-6-methoxyphenol hydroxylase-like FAD-dependent oxidoreductase
MSQVLNTRCCVAGGGPAGMMLGLLLARAGVEVLVLEKHADFLRDFRGDTVHPSTLEVLHELGLLDKFLARPHDEVSELRAVVGNSELVLASFRHLHTRCKFIAMMPQWDFLDFLCAEAEKFPGFRLIRNAEVTGILQGDIGDGKGTGVVRGVRVTMPDGALQVVADLVIAADGRHSVVRRAAGLVVQDLGAPIDVLWMRLPRMAGDPSASGGRINTGALLVMIDRGSYWQCAYVIPKGGMDAVRARGLDAFRGDLVRAAPLLSDRVDVLASWDDITLLSVTVDRLERWYRPGLLRIGDAAHAMSPVGGVGINLAIQDAVAAANILALPLADTRITTAALTPMLAQLEKRRLFPTRVTQAVQVAVQNRLLRPVIAAHGAGVAPMTVPWPLKLLARWPLLQALPAYAVGVGVRPEHVRSPVAHGGVMRRIPTAL